MVASSQKALGANTYAVLTGPAAPALSFKPLSSSCSCRFVISSSSTLHAMYGTAAISGAVQVAGHVNNSLQTKLNNGIALFSSTPTPK